MSDDHSEDVPRPISYGIRSANCPQPGIPEWPDDRTARLDTDGGLAITSLRRTGEWVVALDLDSWAYLSDAL